jgi:hypothetical protein
MPAGLDDQFWWNSRAAGSGEENIGTAARARPSQRGQWSIVGALARGLRLRRQRGQFR